MMRPAMVDRFPDIFAIESKNLGSRHVEFPLDQVDGFTVAFKGFAGSETPQELSLTLQVMM